MEHIEHSELSVYWLDTYNVLDIQRFRCCALVGHSDLKSAILFDTSNVLVFYWVEPVRHWHRFVLLVWTLVSHLDPKGLYWFNSFYITNLIVYFTQYYYWNTRYLSTTLLDTHLCIFHEYVTTSLYIHWCHIVGNPKQIWNFWQLANKLKFSCSPWIMHALFQLDASHFCEENPTNHVYTDYCMHASEVIFVLIYP